MDHVKVFNQILTDLDQCISMLATTTCGVDRNNILNYMRSNINELYMMNNPNQYKIQPAVNDERTFTKEELATYNGKNGMPAYVAIRGIVYDVTNSPAWLSGTHLGLYAGNDLTAEFNTCHHDEIILKTLPIVGKLI